MRSNIENHALVAIWFYNKGTAVEYPGEHVNMFIKKYLLETTDFKNHSEIWYRKYYGSTAHYAQHFTMITLLRKQLWANMICRDSAL